jgi:putative membrane protein
MARIRSIIAGASALALSSLPALAQQTGTTPPPDYYYYRMHMWHGGIFGPIFMVLVIFALVALCMRFGWWGHRGYRHHRMGSGALDILEERFARGEIDKAEFEEKRKTLGR